MFRLICIAIVVEGGIRADGAKFRKNALKRRCGSHEGRLAVCGCVAIRSVGLGLCVNVGHAVAYVEHRGGVEHDGIAYRTVGIGVRHDTRLLIDPGVVCCCSPAVRIEDRAFGDTSREIEGLGRSQLIVNPPVKAVANLRGIA